MKSHSSSLRYPRRKSSAGFTLIELLVAATITAALAGFFFVIIRNVAITWSRAAGRSSSDAQARFVLDQLQLDLQGAFYRDDGNTWLAVDVLDRSDNSGFWQAATNHSKPTGGLSLAMATADIADARFGLAGTWLRFFTTSRGANSAGAPESISAPVAVGYQILRAFNSNNPTRVPTGYLLFRAEVRASTSSDASRPGTIESGYTIDSGNYATHAPNNDGSITGDPASVQSPGSMNPRNLGSVLADNVVDFGLRCYVRDATMPGGLRLVFPATNTRGDLDNSSLAQLRAVFPSDTQATTGNFNRITPDVVDVMIRVLSDDGAALIAGIEGPASALSAPTKYGGDDQQWWWGVVLEKSRVYTRRIALRTETF